MDYVRPNFNDYFQTMLLAANARLTYENLRAIQGAAEADANYRELQFWKGVVRDRYPEVTGTMDTEDAAMRLMGFDRMETAAQDRRSAGLHEPQRVPFRSRIWGLIGLYIVGVIGAIFIMQASFEPSSDTWGEYWNDSQPQGWLFILVILAIAIWYVAPVFVPQRPTYHPQDDSIICQTAYPGRTLRLKDGRSFRVSKTKTPHYYPRRLKFDVWADDGRWFSSDEILWDDAGTAPNHRSIGY